MCASVGEDDDWFRVPTEFDRTTFRFSFEPEREVKAAKFAYFAPYSRTRRLDLIEP